MPVVVVLNRALLVASLGLLNGSLTFANVWPTPWIRWSWALSIELAVAVLVLTWWPRHAARVTRSILPSLWLVLVFGHYLDVTAPGLYGREFNLYWDSSHLGNVAGMLSHAVPLWALALGTVLLLMTGALAFLVSRLAWARVARAVTEPTLRRALFCVATTVVMVFGIQQTSTGTGWLRRVPFANPASQAYGRQARLVVALRTPPALTDSPPLDSPLRALDRADVVLAFVEAYGMVAYDDPVLREGLAEARETLAAAVRDAGRVAVSARIESPTFGASSWLAHLTLLTGIEVRDQYSYVGVMASTRDTLPRAFRRQGYRSVALMPGMRQAWPEGEFYGFDHIYGRAALQYAGPQFGWWGIPDQYTLARLDALELSEARRAPRFVVFPTSTTHAPFGPVAPYQPDWSRVLDPAPFEPAAVTRAMTAVPDLTNLSPSYARAMAYELTTFAGYVREHGADRMVLILVGDHQPVAAVSGPGASYDVPVHVIASPGPLIDRLRAAGFVEGIQPPSPALAKMHALVPILLDAFR